MKGSRVASRYARALLDLSIEQDSLEEVNADMNQLSSIGKESHDLRNLLSSPIVHPKKKASIFEALFGKSMNKVSLAFINLIVKNSRENILLEIADSFIGLYKDHKNITEVSLISATPLEKATKDKIIEKINKHFSGTIELEEKVDPSLVGGFIIKAKDQQVDASIASQLTNLKNILLN